MIENELFHYKYSKKTFKENLLAFFKNILVLIFFISIVYAVLTLFLLGLKFLWLAYSETLVGKSILNAYEDYGHMIELLFSNNLWITNLYVNVIVLLVILSISAVAKFSLLKHYLYDNINKFAKLIVWVLPYTLLSAFILIEFIDYLDLILSSLLCFIPAILFCDISMKFVSDIIPDLVDIKFFFINLTKKIKAGGVKP